MCHLPECKGFHQHPAQKFQSFFFEEDYGAAIQQMKCHSKRLHCGLPSFRWSASLGPQELQAKAAPGPGALQS